MGKFKKDDRVVHLASGHPGVVLATADRQVGRKLYCLVKVDVEGIGVRDGHSQEEYALEGSPEAEEALARVKAREEEHSQERLFAEFAQNVGTLTINLQQVSQLFALLDLALQPGSGVTRSEAAASVRSLGEAVQKSGQLFCLFADKLEAGVNEERED